MAANPGLLDFSHEIWAKISQNLSRRDVQNVRGSCRKLSLMLLDQVMRSVVVPFGPEMFRGSMFGQYGPAINRFGISFEANLRTPDREEPV